MQVALLGTFGLRIAGHAISGVAENSRRLLVFLALHDRTVDRIAIAGTMWPEATESRAGASLRSTLSRLDAHTHEGIVRESAGLSLAGSVAVDFRDSQALAKRLLQPGASPVEADLGPAALAALSSDLLPDWYDEWVLTEAEDWRQLRVNALEAMARLLTAGGQLPGAAGAARAAMRVEPLRESAHASLIRVHLAEGNQSEALRVFDRYRALLFTELGLEPTPLLSDLVVSIRKR
jgi:DNA-binding SARP family transcriptional activator